MLLLLKEYILLDELIHLAIALSVGLLFYWRYRRWPLILTALLFGFLIDVDHLFDYFVHFGPQFKLADFLNVDTYMKASGKIYILLHGWEYLLIFGFLGRWLEKKLKLQGLAWTMTLAYFGHLFWDYSGFYKSPLVYSFIFRILNNFELGKMFF